MNCPICNGDHESYNCPHGPPGKVEYRTVKNITGLTPGQIVWSTGWDAVAGAGVGSADDSDTCNRWADSKLKAFKERWP